MTAARQGWSDDRIDGLERKVDEGSARMGERFDRVDDRFKLVDQRLERIDDGIAGMQTEMHALHRTLAQYALALTTALMSLVAAMGGLILTQV